MCTCISIWGNLGWGESVKWDIDHMMHNFEGLDETRNLM